MSKIYAGLDERLQKLDARDVSYQFDLERDIPWNDLAKPGNFTPEALFEALGYDSSALRANAEAWEMFNWAHCLATCETFSALEVSIVEFLEWNGENIMAHRSNQLLEVEERKHIAMFDRMAGMLRAARPDLVELYDRVFRNPHASDRKVSDVAEKRHLSYWALATFFEEQSVHVYRDLDKDKSSHPLWKKINHAHMVEEVQHLVTDSAHLDSLTVSPAVRKEVETEMVFFLTFGFDDLWAFSAPMKMLKERFPELALKRKMPLTKTPMMEIYRSSPMYRRTRQSVPALARPA